MTKHFANKIALVGIVFFATAFSFFPLTDTDIWWHLACAREWVTTWTPVRTPVVNVHEYFQLAVGAVYGLGGAPLLVAFKALLWCVVFTLFLHPARHSECHSELVSESVSLFKCHAGLIPASPSLLKLTVSAFLLFVFRYHFEIRPVLLSLLFLGIYWNVLPRLFNERLCEPHRGETLFPVPCSLKPVTLLLVFAVLFIQWLWCKCQGLYILGPIFATLVLGAEFFEEKRRGGLYIKWSAKTIVPQVGFVWLLWLMPFLHREGLGLFLYPFGLLDRLLGLNPSAAVFASQIAENRSPLTLLMAGENVLDDLLMLLMSLAGVVIGIKYLVLIMCHPERNTARYVVEGSRYLWFLITAILVLIAERNLVLFLPVFLSVFWGACDKLRKFLSSKFYQLSPDTVVRTPNSELRIKTLVSRLMPHVSRLSSLVFLAFLLGLWGRSVSAYDSAVAYRRVPVEAAKWMAEHPHAGRLFNDDRAGGYLAFVNPADSVYIDGRFILKTADFFERYLSYAQDPARFIADADSLGVDRAVFPLRYYARWDSLWRALERDSRWHLVYRDEYFAVFDKE